MYIPWTLPQTHLRATKLQAEAQWSAAHPNFCSVQSPVNEHIQQKGDDPRRHLRDCQRTENVGQEKAVGEDICKLQNGTLCLPSPTGPKQRELPDLTVIHIVISLSRWRGQIAYARGRCCSFDPSQNLCRQISSERSASFFCLGCRMCVQVWERPLARTHS